MTFQNPSMQGSEVMLCIKKRKAAWTYERPEAICPCNFFEVEGIKIQTNTQHIDDHQFQWTGYS